MARHGRLTQQLLSGGSGKTRRLSTVPRLSVYRHASIYRKQALYQFHRDTPPLKILADETLERIPSLNGTMLTEAPITEAPTLLAHRYHYPSITRRKPELISKDSAPSNCCVTRLKQLAGTHGVIQKAHGETLASVTILASVTVFAPCVSLNWRQATPRLV